ncbi:hypothetical protein H0X48_06445 [Candidatus Dependentiae bacterium]|nr:hypothetical protein [Candidatus Dependentiae bacterium]
MKKNMYLSLLLCLSMPIITRAMDQDGETMPLLDNQPTQQSYTLQDDIIIDINPLVASSDSEAQQKIDGNQLIHSLPDEIWHRIANYLDFKDPALVQFIALYFGLPQDKVEQIALYLKQYYKKQSTDTKEWLDKTRTSQAFKTAHVPYAHQAIKKALREHMQAVTIDLQQRFNLILTDQNSKLEELFDNEYSTIIT